MSGPTGTLVRGEPRKRTSHTGIPQKSKKRIFVSLGCFFFFFLFVLIFFRTSTELNDSAANAQRPNDFSAKNALRLFTSPENRASRVGYDVNGVRHCLARYYMAIALDRLLDDSRNHDS